MVAADLESPPMTFALGKTSLSRCTHVNPRLMRVVHAAIARSPVDFGITEEQSRTVAEQQHKIDQGVSFLKDPRNGRHVIPLGGQWSRAIDLVPWVDGRFQWGDDHWRVKTADGRVLEPFFDIAAAMRSASIELAEPLIWGGIWDQQLRDLPEDAKGIAQALEDYKRRHSGPDHLDGPHFELAHP